MTSEPRRDPVPGAVWQRYAIHPEHRERLLGQRGCVVWLTGLSGSGKSTLAGACEHFLVDQGRLAFVLDGDNIRHGLSRDLGFSEAERAEHIRRVSHAAALLADCGVIVLAAFIAPLRAMRTAAREVVGAGRFLEVHIATPLAVCACRDPKGLYDKAKRGALAGLTGVSAPYEAPDDPDLTIDTSTGTSDGHLEALVGLLRGRGFLDPPRD